MQQGIPVVMNAAMDVVALFVIAIIIFNIVSSIVKGLKSAASKAANANDAEASQRLAQSLQRTPVATQVAAAATQVAAARAAELARLRKALLASADVSDADEAASVPPAQLRVSVPARAPLSSGSSMAAGLQARALQLQPKSLVPSMVTMASAPPAPSGWSLETPGSLMSLESAATAFDQLAISGSAAAVAQSAAAAASVASTPLALLQGSDSGMNLFIAAAIVGPCAAFRPLGHTPGGW